MLKKILEQLPYIWLIALHQTTKNIESNIFIEITAGDATNEMK